MAGSLPAQQVTRRFGRMPALRPNSDGIMSAGHEWKKSKNWDFWWCNRCGTLMNGEEMPGKYDLTTTLPAGLEQTPGLTCEEVVVFEVMES